MKHSISPRWRASAVLIVAFIAAIAIGGAERGWGTIPEVLPIPIAIGIFVYVMGRTDTDYGAALRRELDERQIQRRLQIQALVGRMLSIAVAIAYLVAVTQKVMLWPWAVLLATMALSFIGGRMLYGDRERGEDRV